jgi:hypothetical protein
MVNERIPHIAALNWHQCDLLHKGTQIKGFYIREMLDVLLNKAKSTNPLNFTVTTLFNGKMVGIENTINADALILRLTHGPFNLYAFTHPFTVQTTGDECEIKVSR